MPSAGRAGSKPRRSRRRPIGWRSTAGSGKAPSGGLMRCSRSCRPRRRGLHDTPDDDPDVANDRSAAMTTHATLNVTTPGDREIVMTRVFGAARRLVFDCYTKPELLKRWLTGPDGWTFVTCDNDLTIGGTFRWVWRGA